jgi:hypothetical protein
VLPSIFVSVCVCVCLCLSVRPYGDMSADASRAGLCAFFVAGKRRFCPMSVRTGHTYCPQHSASSRVPCPLDPHHSVDATRLAAHLSICTSARRAASQPACVVPGFVARARAHLCPRSTTTTTTVVVDNDDADALVVDTDTDTDTVASVRRLAARIATALHIACGHADAAEPPPLDEAHLNRHAQAAAAAAAAGKHARQAASLVAHLASVGLLDRRRFAYVDFGAGRGTLLEHVAEALHALPTSPDECAVAGAEAEAAGPGPGRVPCLCIDRASTRHKTDARLRHAVGTSCIVERVRWRHRHGAHSRGCGCGCCCGERQ